MLVQEIIKELINPKVKTFQGIKTIEVTPIKEYNDESCKLYYQAVTTMYIRFNNYKFVDEFLHLYIDKYVVATLRYEYYNFKAMTD